MSTIGACRSDGEVEKGAPPSAVVLISLDTFRADRLPLYGYERNTAPNVTAFGEESLTFTAVSAQATQTLIFHKSLFTGKYPLRLIRETTNADNETLESLENPTRFLINTFRHLRAEPLVEKLRDAGYRTAAFVDGGWVRRDLGFARGFDEFRDESGGHLAGIVPRVYRWLEQHHERRFFLFVHAYDLHCPYVCREPYNSLFCPDHASHIAMKGKCAKTDFMNMTLTENDRRTISDHYDGGIASADAYIGDFLNKLRELGVFDEALIILTSDHGDSLGEHGQIGHGGLQLEQLLIPLIVKLPASWNVTPRKYHQPIELADVMPTVSDVLNIDVPESLDGRSLLPLVFEGDWDKKYLVAQTTFRAGRKRVSRPTSRAILVPDRWLLVQELADDSTTVFDLLKDPKALTAMEGMSRN